MPKQTLLAGAAFALLSALAGGPAFAQPIVVQTSAPRVGHIGVQPYLRIPVGSRAEAAALKAEQDAMMSAQQATTKKAGKKR